MFLEFLSVAVILILIGRRSKDSNMIEEKQDRIDIMMVTYNRLDLTKQTLEGLLESADVLFNLIIIDNASSDNTVEYLKEFCGKNKGTGLFNDFTIVENKKNLGNATGRNQALIRSKEEWLATLDNDVICPNKWLSNCIGILKENKQFAMCGINFEGTSYPMITLKGRSFQEKLKGNLGGACMVFNRTLYKAIGHFNNVDYSKVFAMDDADYNMRARVLGFRLAYWANGIHLGEDNSDTGEYRKMKTVEHDSYIKKFQENCQLYYSRKKPIYIPFKDIY
jgi:GT2 family glycosyltransferase